MALLFLDSFDHYATADRTEKYASTLGTVTISASGGRRSSGALQTAGTSAALTGRVLSPAPHATAVVGFAYRFNATAGGTVGVLDIRAGGTVQVTLCLNSVGTLHVRRGNTAGTILGTATSSLTAATFYYVEMKVAIHASTGTLALRVNGVDVFTPLTGQNTSNTGAAAWDALLLGNTSAAMAITQQFDDLYLLDGSGSSPWNDFLGDCRVDARYPTAEGASSAWAPLSGTDNALMVDETAPDDDTTYNSTVTINATDTHVTENAPVVGAAIFGIQHCLSMKKSDAGACTVSPVIRHSSVDYPGAALSPSTAYAYSLQVAQVNPGTSAQWTEADFNAAEFGYKRVS